MAQIVDPGMGVWLLDLADRPGEPVPPDPFRRTLLNQPRNLTKPLNRENPALHILELVESISLSGLITYQLLVYL